MILATLFLNLMNFGPVNPEFNIAKGVLSLVAFFKTIVSDQLSQDQLDRFSQHFYRMVCIWW